MVRKEVILTSLALLVRSVKTSLGSAVDTTLKISATFRVLIVPGGKATNVVFGVAEILATKMILSTAVIYMSFRSNEPVRHCIALDVSRPLPILESLINATTAQIGLFDTEKEKEEATCQVARLTMILPYLEAVLTRKNKSVGTFIVEAKRELIVRTRLLIALQIVEVLPNTSSYHLVANFTRKFITVSKHLRLANPKKRPTLVLNMLDDIDTDRLDTQFESVNACPE